MQIRVAYALHNEPTRWSRKLLGQMTIDRGCVSVDAAQPVMLKLTEIRGLSFRRSFLCSASGKGRGWPCRITGLVVLAQRHLAE
jgi:hypothetical protein